MASYVFLRLNGIQVTASNDSYERITLDVAQGWADKTQIALFFRKHSKKISK